MTLTISRDRQTIAQDRLHQLAVVSQHRRLTGVKTVGLRPAETEAQAQITMLGGFSFDPGSRSRKARECRSSRPRA